VSIVISHEMYKDLGTLLHGELTEAGFKTNRDYPVNVEKRKNINEPGKRDYYYSWNMAYQFGSIRYRIIKSAKRRVHWSKDLLDKYKNGLMTATQINAINIISSASVAGLDLTRFMSFRMEKAYFEDKMYSDWRISHLHLDPTPSAKSIHQTRLAHFVERTGPILFVFHKNDGLYLIDIQPHGSEHRDVWGTQNFLEIIHRDWPSVVAEHILPNVSPTSDCIISDSDRFSLREAGVSCPIVMADGTVYYPWGGGINSAGGSSEVVGWADSLIISCHRHLENVEKRKEEIVESIERLSGTKLSELNLTLTLDQKNRPIFIEKSLKVALSTPAAEDLPLRGPAYSVDLRTLR